MLNPFYVMPLQIICLWRNVGTTGFKRHYPITLERDSSTGASTTIFDSLLQKTHLLEVGSPMLHIPSGVLVMPAFPSLPLLPWVISEQSWKVDERVLPQKDKPFFLKEHASGPLRCIDEQIKAVQI